MSYTISRISVESLRTYDSRRISRLFSVLDLDLVSYSSVYLESSLDSRESSAVLAIMAILF